MLFACQHVSASCAIAFGRTPQPCCMLCGFETGRQHLTGVRSPGAGRPLCTSPRIRTHIFRPRGHSYSLIVYVEICTAQGRVKRMQARVIAAHNEELLV